MNYNDIQYIYIYTVYICIYQHLQRGAILSPKNDDAEGPLYGSPLRAAKNLLNLMLDFIANALISRY